MRLAAFTFVIGFTLVTALRAILDNQCAIFQEAGLARVHQIHDGAVVAERGAAAKIGDGGEDVFHGQTLGSNGFQARVSEEIATRVFGFGNAVSHQNQAIPGVQTAMIALVVGVGQQADWQVAMGRRITS